jgi:hypothetical protein
MCGRSGNGPPRFPVILTDWNMPVMSGLELTQHLRANGMMDTYIIDRWQCKEGQAAAPGKCELEFASQQSLASSPMRSDVNIRFQRVCALQRSMLDHCGPALDPRSDAVPMEMEVFVCAQIPNFINSTSRLTTLDRGRCASVG